MTATMPTQEQVDKIATALAPDVVRIRVNAGQDWSEHPALYFRVVLSDEASRPMRLADITDEVRTKLTEALGLSQSDRIPYFRFRSQSEQTKIKELAWE